MRDKGSGSVHQRKDRRWAGTIEAGWTSRGTRRRITVYAPTKREALQKMKAKQREISMQGIPDEQTQQTLTVKAFAATYLEHRQATTSTSSSANDASNLNLWVIPTIGHVRLNRLGAQHIRAVQNAVRDAGRKASTVERVHVVLIKMLKTAVAEGHHIPQAVFAVPKPRRNESTRGAIPHADAVKIIATSVRTGQLARVLVAFLAAARPAEALGLTWDAVNFERGTLDISWQLKTLRYKDRANKAAGFVIPEGDEVRHLRFAYHLKRPKTAAGKRVIPLVPPLRDALLAWREVCPHSEWGLVFPRENGLPQTAKNDVAAWKALCIDAGVPEYDLYSARHTAASLLKSLGVPDEVIVRIMGHASILSTQAYIHIDSVQVAAALEGVAGRLGLEG
ncbi:site-specific integrase [Trueperella pyogenes]|uniref:tyrosine-type recombinase/integrase n=1 Tax=Trueperella pyogenes TaxID=1661 RepID=UPI0032491132